MAQPIQQLSLVSPAFLGLNTQDSSIDMDQQFAVVADNCVINESGRLATRKGQSGLTSDSAELQARPVESLYKFTDVGGTDYFLSTGNNKILQGDNVLTDVTPPLLSVTDDHWQWAELNEKVYAFQRNHEPIYFDPTTNTVDLVDNAHHGTPPHANAVIAAYGRLWAGDVDGDRATLYWSDTLAGTHWSGGSSGSLDLKTVWPSGADSIVALAAHNNFLVIFGERSILIYEGAEDPTNSLALVDFIKGVGCFARDSVVNVGTDLLFMSNEGLRSLGRTIQEKSIALGILSRNIRNELQTSLTEASRVNMKATLIPEQSLYVVSFPDRQIAYAFDVRQPLETGAFRVTRWTTISHHAYYTDPTGITYIGSRTGLGFYDGYLEKGADYYLKYQSPRLSFGDTTRLKFLKNLTAIFVGSGTTPVVLRWGYGFDNTFKSRSFNISTGENIAEFNVSEFNVGEYSVAEVTDTFHAKANGSGTILNIALEAKVSGSYLAVQGFNLQTLLGKNTNG